MNCQTSIFQEKVISPCYIMAQRMRTKTNRLKKFEPLGSREFVDFSNFDQISIHNINSACEKYDEMAKGSCDVLLSSRGPSCYTTEQLIGKKFILFNSGIRRSRSAIEGAREDGKCCIQHPKTPIWQAATKQINSCSPKCALESISKVCFDCRFIAGLELIELPDVSLVTMKVTVLLIRNGKYLPLSPFFRS